MGIVTIKHEVPAGETFEFSVQCQAPEKEGRYTAFFRLQTGRIKFGHKVSCDILCVHPIAESPIVAKTVEQPVQMIAQDVVEAAADMHRSISFLFSSMKAANL